MLYFSSLLQTNPTYKPAADNLFAALHLAGVAYRLLDNTRDIWLRDFMPVQRSDGKYVSFRYEPSYLKDVPELRTNFKKDISDPFPAEQILYSDINLDGGNVVFTPSKRKAVISDRIFSENANKNRADLVSELSAVLDAEIMIIESLPSDMTGHADGMVRFVTEDTVLINRTDFKRGLEQRQARQFKKLGFQVIEFPYYQCGGISAEGTYLNYLETAFHIFLPVFGSNMDAAAFALASQIFSKEVVPVEAQSLSAEGGVLNCISWEC